MSKVIKDFLANDFEQKLYLGAIQNLNDMDNPLRLNNFAYSIRELLRHLLKRLAPDDAVTQCHWYTNETGKPDGITRRQRATYAVQGGLTSKYLESELQLDTKEVHKALIVAIDQLSRYTHIEPEVFEIDDQKIAQFASDTLKVLENLLETILICRENIISGLASEIDDSVAEEAIRETIEALDEIASHHYIDEVYVDNVIITDINQHSIFFTATGTIGTELQWGSNSDRKKDIGAVRSESFPFTCSLLSSVLDPQTLEVSTGGLRIDTSSWFGEDEIEGSQDHLN